MKIYLLLAIALISPSAYATADCLAKDEAAENIVAFLTTRDFVEFDWHADDINPQVTPALKSLLVPVNAHGSERVRIYGAEAKKVKKELFEEFFQALEPRGSHGWVAYFWLNEGGNAAYVSCVGDVILEYEYQGPL